MRRLALLCCAALALLPAALAAPAPEQPHTSNWAVLVATSKYWYNYRHIANTLSFYRTVKRLGIPDSNIILMLAEDVACNPRNAYPGQVFNDESHALNVYGSAVEVDYRGYEVTVEALIRVLTGRHDPAVPRPKRMLSDRGSNVLVYISGHGGNEFMKFQDTQELMAQDVADAVQQMHEKGRYRELLLIVETCQAATLYSKIRSPNVLSMASSLKGESSYSYLTDGDVGLSLIDRFTWSTLDFFERVDIHSSLSLADLVQIYRFEVLDSHFHYDTSHYPRPLGSVPVAAFFGSIAATPPTPLLNATAGLLPLLDVAPSGAGGASSDGSSSSSSSSSSSGSSGSSGGGSSSGSSSGTGGEQTCSSRSECQLAAATPLAAEVPGAAPPPGLLAGQPQARSLAGVWAGLCVLAVVVAGASLLQ